MTRDELQRTRADIGGMLARGALGQIPIVGSLLAELVGEVIPNQRVDRLGRLLVALGKKIEHLEREFLESRLRDQQVVDVLEDGMLQASRALTDERIERIAGLLRGGLADVEVEAARYKHLLSLLGQVDDQELILLCSYSRKLQDDASFRERHERVLRPPAVAIGSAPLELEDAAIRGSRLNHLVRLGLLQNTFRMPKRGEFPEFDAYSGTLKATGLSLTEVGRLLLRAIEVLGSDES